MSIIIGGTNIKPSDERLQLILDALRSYEEEWQFALDNGDADDLAQAPNKIEQIKSIIDFLNRSAS